MSELWDYGTGHWWYGRRADSSQRLRMRRFFVAVASYGLWVLATLLAQLLGLLTIPLDRLLSAIAALLACQLLFYFLFFTGLNRRFAEPALTVPQMFVGLFFAFLLVALWPDFRGHLLMTTVVTLLFGVFRLSSRQFVALALVAFAAYASLVTFEMTAGIGARTAAEHTLSLTIFAIVLAWTVIFGTYVSNLRHRLSARNDELEEALIRNRHLAERDELTRLYNRRYLMGVLAQELSRAERSGRPLSVALIDLDHFKRVNDQYGHSAGDRVLRDFGRFLVAELRAQDIAGVATDPGPGGGGINGTVGRYGGEEFMLILPETDQDAARSCLERLRSGQDRHTRAASSAPHVTLSAGVAQYLAGEQLESLLRRADRALYRAKDAGRNRVCVAL